MKNPIALCLLLYSARLFSQGSWIQKANVGGSPRNEPVGFSIGNYGYIGTGQDPYNNLNDFWKYDPGNNTWTQIANFQGFPRSGAAAFVINNFAYVGSGGDGNVTLYNDFWKYDPSLNSWLQIAAFPGPARARGISFAIGSKGYFGTGTNYPNCYSDIWEYNPSSDSWMQVASFFSSTGRADAFSFTIGNKAYLGTGYNSSGTPYNDFWEYTPSIGMWSQLANVPGTLRRDGFGFSIGTKGYAGGGWTQGLLNDVYEYNPLTNSWTQKPNYPGGTMGTGGYGGVGFSINGKGYLGILCDFIVGWASDFWEYDPNAVADINEISVSNSVTVYPNPATTQVNFNFNDELKNGSLAIYDLAGKEIRNLTISEKELILQREEIPAGVYFWKVNDGKKHTASGMIIFE